MAFSPVSWTSVEQLNILAANHFISIPFVIAADALLVIFLFILIFQTAKRISLNGFLTEEARCDMLEIENLTKTFGTQTVISDISMTLVSGKIYGLVGRNGSGKTMLMKMILGFVSPSSGSIKIEGKVLGKDISMPDRIGAIIENPGFLPEYSGFKNLKFLAMIHHKISNEEIRDAMRIVGLDPDSKKHVGKYSLGMRQRLGIAQAIMEDPDILLLDEPLNGLDNEGVEEIRKVLLSLKEKGKLIILASHSKEDIQILCDTVFRMDHGKIIATETNKPMGTERGSRKVGKAKRMKSSRPCGA